MKSRLILSAIAVLALAHAAFGQSYNIDWYKVSGGGGTSTGGVYSLSGTIGQHDAGGPMTGPGYSVVGGFWSLYALQTPGAPFLTIVRTNSNMALVYWQSPSIGFELLQNTNVTTTNWVTPAETIFDNGSYKYILVNPPVGNRYFRLRNP